MDDVAFDTYVTGSQLLTNEFSHMTETGIKKRNGLLYAFYFSRIGFMAPFIHSLYHYFR